MYCILTPSPFHLITIHILCWEGGGEGKSVVVSRIRVVLVTPTVYVSLNAFYELFLDNPNCLISFADYRPRRRREFNPYGPTTVKKYVELRFP